MAMLTFVLLGLFSLYKVECSEEIINVPEFVESINSIEGLSWKADTYGFESMKVNDVKKLLGTKLLSKQQLEKVAQKSSIVSTDDGDLPKNFSWTHTDRTKCPISTIRNQAQCGSCWAVSTASAFADRVCIKSKGKHRTPLSGNYITSCDTSNYGCNGGLMDRVNNFLVKTGVITGGEYESDEGCQPYTMRPCGFPEDFPCTGNEYSPKCRKTKCSNDWYPTKYEIQENTFRALTWSFLSPNDRAIMRDIYENGPVTAAFMVYMDFMYYKKGIYEKSPMAQPAGGHAVRVVGWGEENNVKYWLVANSWGEKWGENGFFRIKRGVNMCDFETQMSSLIPNV